MRSTCFVWAISLFVGIMGVAVCSRRCVMENMIKEFKHGLSLDKFPSRKYHANWAYFLIGQLAFNLVAWFKRLILPAEFLTATIKTLRHRVFNLAGKIVA